MGWDPESGACQACGHPLGDSDPHSPHLGPGDWGCGQDDDTEFCTCDTSVHAGCCWECNPKEPRGVRW